MKKWLIFVLCSLMLLAATACGQETAEPDAPTVTEPTAAPTENLDGTGGDNGDDNCAVHNRHYHLAVANFPMEMKQAFLDHLGENYDEAELNICDFVRFHNITREEVIESYGGMWTEENLDEIAWNHGNGCPYTKNQFLDAIFGDDPELTAWVFAPTSTWPRASAWSLLGEEGMVPEEWPPEGYGFGETRPVEEPAE